MTLRACHECGKQVSSEAAACPHCGAKPKAGIGIGTIAKLFVAGIFGVFVFSCVSSFQRPSGGPAPTDAELRAARQKNETYTAVRKMLRQLRDSMRDPQSFTAEQVHVSADGLTFCVSYQAKNGFGGMNRESAAVIGGSIFRDAMTWKRECAGGKSLQDFSYAANAL